jgi:hypothetical protein
MGHRMLKLIVLKTSLRVRASRLCAQIRTIVNKLTGRSTNDTHVKYKGWEEAKSSWWWLSTQAEAISRLR